MKPIYQQYAKEIKKNLGYHATWNPGTPLQLGDYGVVVDGVFKRKGNITGERYSISFEVRTDKSKTPLEHYSQNSVALTTKLAGSVPPQVSALTNADAGIIVEFGRENAILFKANNTTTLSIEDTETLGDALIKLYEEGKWDGKFLVITKLIKAQSATIIISGNAGGKIELKANANIGIPNLDIADTELKLFPKFENNIATKIISEEGLTPLFDVMGVNKGFFSSPKIRHKAIAPKKTTFNVEEIRFIGIDNLSKW